MPAGNGDRSAVLEAATGEQRWTADTGIVTGRPVVGADWVAGNTIPALDFLIALVHAADVIMGVFILFMVFLHWASFRRLAARMRQSGAERTSGVATDGGTDRRDPAGGETDPTTGGDAE